MASSGGVAGLDGPRQSRFGAGEAADWSTIGRAIVGRCSAFLGKADIPIIGKQDTDATSLASEKSDSDAMLGADASARPVVS